MGHFINDEQDFVAVVNEYRQEPWHSLGQRVDKAMTAEKALKLANLGEWNMTLEPVMWFEESVDDVLVMPSKWVVVRTDPKTGNREGLGVVGSGYELFPNEEAFAWMDGVVGEINGAHYDTAGFLRPLAKDGTAQAQVFLTIDLADAGEIVLDPKGANDRMQLKLYGTFGHDGSLAFTTGLSLMRIVCRNTQQGALGSSVSQWKTKHTRGMRERMDQAREALGLSLRYVDEVTKRAEELVQQAYTTKEFDRLITQVFPMPSKDDKHYKSKAERQEAMHDDMRWLFVKAPTNENITGTKWGALQAVGEFIDWYRPVRGHTTGNTEKVRVQRATGTVTGAGDAKKRRTLQLLTA